jgi:hypothetical protein
LPVSRRGPDPDTAASLGALVPLLPYLAGLPYLAATLIVTAVALISGGMVVGRLTGTPLGVRLFAPHVVISEARSGTGSALG